MGSQFDIKDVGAYAAQGKSQTCNVRVCRPTKVRSIGGDRKKKAGTGGSLRM